MDYIIRAEIPVSPGVVLYYKHGPDWSEDKGDFGKWVNRLAFEYECLTGRSVQTFHTGTDPVVAIDRLSGSSTRLMPIWFVYGLNPKGESEPRAVISIKCCKPFGVWKDGC